MEKKTSEGYGKSYYLDNDPNYIPTGESPIAAKKKSNAKKPSVMTNKKYLSNFEKQDPLSNPIDYKVGDDVEYLGWSAYKYRTCRIIRIDTYKWGVKYILQGIKKDGTLGKYTSDADAYTYDYWFNRNERS